MSVVPLVTVVIPAWNRPDHLRRAIASVHMQRGVSTEVIVVDDASDTDLACELCDIKQVTWLRNDRNRGGGYSRNRGLDKANGQFIQFLDDDDVLLPGKLQKQVEQFSNSTVNNLAMVSCHARDLRSGEQVIRYNHFRGNIYRASLRAYTVQLTSSMLFRTDVVRQVGGFDHDLPSSQEYDLVIRLSRHFGVDYVDDILVQLNRSHHQINTNFNKKRDGAVRLFRKHDAAYREQGTGFWLFMQAKLTALMLRFAIGAWLGERAYRSTIQIGRAHV